MRIHPTSPSPNGPKTTRLSILDNLSARFALTHVIFIYETLPADDFKAKLINSLRKTLDDYPHFSGQLSWAPIRNGKGGRSQVSYGGGEKADEPGVGLEVVKLLVSTSKFLLSPRSAEEEEEGVRVVKESIKELEPTGKVALWDLKQTHDNDGLSLPGIRIQLSIFEDGYAIAVKMAHVLGDASTLTAFVRRWACYNTGIQPGPTPLFDPSLVDRCMKKQERDMRTDEEKLNDASKLPCHRYDWHAMDNPVYPSFLKSTTQNSIALAPQADGKRDDLEPAPWESWDMSQPAGHVQLYLSAKELERLKKKALLLASGSDPNVRLSTLDALLAYIWTLINEARYPNNITIEDQNVYLNCSLNARHRLSEPLPDYFIGSAMFISHVATPVRTFYRGKGQSPMYYRSSKLAPEFRRTIEKFTPSAAADLLFSLDAEPVPQRIWQAFCGKRHTLVTSWLRLGIWDIDFGHGVPADVRAVVPEMDGIVQIMEAKGEDGWNVDVYLEEWERLVVLMEMEMEYRRAGGA